MTNLNALLTSLVLLSTVGCSRGTQSAACDANAIAGVGASAGKELAFSGCKFQSQGNDVVAFGDATGTGPSIDCKLKGGKAAVDQFRKDAIKIGQSKLKLDVHGISASKNLMTDCEISTHD